MFQSNENSTDGILQHFYLNKKDVTVIRKILDARNNRIKILQFNIFIFLEKHSKLYIFQLYNASIRKRYCCRAKKYASINILQNV